MSEEPTPQKKALRAMRAESPERVVTDPFNEVVPVTRYHTMRNNANSGVARFGDNQIGKAAEPNREDDTPERPPPINNVQGRQGLAEWDVNEPRPRKTLRAMRAETPERVVTDPFNEILPVAVYHEMMRNRGQMGEAAQPNRQGDSLERPRPSNNEKKRQGSSILRYASSQDTDTDSSNDQPKVEKSKRLRKTPSKDSHRPSTSHEIGRRGSSSMGGPRSALAQRYSMEQNTERRALLVGRPRSSSESESDSTFEDDDEQSTSSQQSRSPSPSAASD